MGIGAAFGKDNELPNLPSWDELMAMHPERLEDDRG